MQRRVSHLGRWGHFGASGSCNIGEHTWVARGHLEPLEFLGALLGDTSFTRRLDHLGHLVWRGGGGGGEGAMFDDFCFAWLNNTTPSPGT